MADARIPDEYFQVPSSARVWNYWLGGKDNYPVDRAAGDAVIASYPQIVTLARRSRQLLVRAVRTLAGEFGVRQFLDIGTGLPTMTNTHEVAQSITPDARIVYVDNDPIVLAHARALLTDTTPEGVTTYVDADVHDPELIIADARNVLNLREPVAVMLLGVLGYVADTAEARSIVTTLMDAMPSGSYLLVRDNANASAGSRAAADEYAQRSSDPYHLRTVDELAGMFVGLDMVEPGLVPTELWRPDPVEVGAQPDDATTHTGDHTGLARKP